MTLVAALSALAFLVRRRARPISLIFMMCAFSALGFASASHRARGALQVSLPLDAARPVVCEGRVRGEPARKRWGIVFDLDILSCEAGGILSDAHGGVRASATYRFVGEEIGPGDVVRAPFVFKRPREYGGSGSFSYGRYLMARGVGAMAYARGRIERVGAGGGPDAWMGRWRAGLRRTIRERVPQREAQVVEALATGTRTQMDDGVRESFSRAGIAHLLAISGLHVGYVALMIYLLVRFTLGRVPALVSRVPVARLAAFVTLPLAWLYVAFVGLPMSAVRAGLMLTVYLVGAIAGLRQDALTTLAAAVIAVLVSMPLSILDISFQLSVTAVLGIVVVALPLMRRVDGRLRGRGPARALVRRAFALVVISAAAALFTAPLVAYHFGTYTLMGPIINMVAVPLVAAGLMPAIILATLLAPLAPWAAGHVFWLSGKLSGALIDCAEWASSSGSSLTGNVSPSAWEMAFAYAVLTIVIAPAIIVRRPS